MNPERKRKKRTVAVEVNGKNISLTYTQAHILKAFIKDPILNTPNVHEKVWQEMKDTRTSLYSVDIQVQTLMFELNKQCIDGDKVMTRNKLPKSSGVKGHQSTIFELNTKVKINFQKEEEENY